MRGAGVEHPGRAGMMLALLDQDLREAGEPLVSHALTTQLDVDSGDFSAT